MDLVDLVGCRKSLASCSRYEVHSPALRMRKELSDNTLISPFPCIFPSSPSHFHFPSFFSPAPPPATSVLFRFRRDKEEEEEEEEFDSLESCTPVV